MEYLIIGNGPAGVQAALAARKQDPQANVTIISKESHLFYYRYYLPHFLAGAKDESKLLVHPESFYGKKGINLLLGRRVVKVSPDRSLVTLDDGRELSYSSLVVATGSGARRPVWPGGDLDAVVTLREWDDVPRILEKIRTSQEAVVVGGGLLGIELVWAFRERGLRVSYLIKEDRFWPQMLDTTASDIIERRVEQAGVVLMTNESIKEIEGKGGRVDSVRTESGKRITCQLLGVAIGAVPEAGFLADSGIEVDRGVVVDEYLRSSVPSVYAAGDVAQAYDVVHGEHRINTSWLNAYRQGDIAGANMAGASKTFAGGIPYNMMEIYGISFVSMGLPNVSGEEYRTVSHLDASRDVYQKLVLEDGTLVGATLLGEVGRAKYFEELIKRQVNIGGSGEQLLDPEFDLQSLLESA